MCLRPRKEVINTIIPLKGVYGVYYTVYSTQYTGYTIHNGRRAHASNKHDHFLLGKLCVCVLIMSTV